MCLVHGKCFRAILLGYVLADPRHNCKLHADLFPRNLMSVMLFLLHVVPKHWNTYLIKYVPITVPN